MPPGKVDPWDQLKLPNAGSKWQTPASMKIDLRYCHLQIVERWNWSRFCRLAAFLNVTAAELASIACIPHRQIESFKVRNRLLNRSAALVLTILERHVAGEYTKDVIDNPFPQLNAVAPVKQP